MNKEYLENICRQNVDNSIDLYLKMKASFGDGITTNGERNIMTAKINAYSRMYCSVIRLLELDDDSDDWKNTKYKYFDRLIEPRIKADPENLQYFLTKFNISY